MSVTTTSVTCPQCERPARVTEPFAFGVDRLRSTLSCGHVVARDRLAQ
jgi:hypothetical protein